MAEEANQPKTKTEAKPKAEAPAKTSVLTDEDQREITKAILSLIHI